MSATFTGNKALMLEEKLLFEMARCCARLRT